LAPASSWWRSKEFKEKTKRNGRAPDFSALSIFATVLSAFVRNLLTQQVALH
jgi:hypothetical protein